MTCKKYIVILFLLCSQFCFAQNLVQNGSFEDSLGNQSLSGWDVGDTSYMSFSNDVPLNGGLWSVYLISSPGPNSYIINTLTGITGTYVYKFTLWTKYIMYGLARPSYFGIGIKMNSLVWNPDTMLQQSIVYVYDTTLNYWQQITLIDTITSSAQDTIAMILFCGSRITPGPLDTISFDSIELTVTDSLTSAQNTIIHTPDIKIYPNPFNNNTTIKFKNEKNNYIQLTLFTITGQIIRKIETSKDRISIERDELSDGMYFYQLINQNNGTLLGEGKLVLQ